MNCPSSLGTIDIRVKMERLIEFLFDDDSIALPEKKESLRQNIIFHSSSTTTKQLKKRQCSTNLIDSKEFLYMDVIVSFLSDLIWTTS